MNVRNQIDSHFLVGRTYRHDSCIINTIPLIVIMGAPYSGKSRLITSWLNLQNEFIVKVLRKVTTRNPRQYENNSPPYSFISEKQFLTLKDRGELLWVENNFTFNYGYLKKDFCQASKVNSILLLVTNLKDGYSFLKKYFNNVLFVYILPCSIDYSLSSDVDRVITTLSSRILHNKRRTFKDLKDYCTIELNILSKVSDVHVLINNSGEDNFNFCLNEFSNVINSFNYSKRESIFKTFP